MKRLSSYKILRNIYVEGLGEFRKGTTAALNKEEANMFPSSAIAKQADYLQGFDDQAATGDGLGIDWDTDLSIADEEGEYDDDGEPL